MDASCCHLRLQVEILLGETIEQSGTPGSDQVCLAAPARGVGGVPGCWIITAALTVVVTNIGGSFAIARPVIAVGRSHWESAVHIRAGQDVVRVGIISASVDRCALFRDRVLLGELVLVTVEVVDVGRYDDTFHVLPRTAADSIPSVNGGLIAAARRAEISAPCSAGGTGCSGELLTMGIGSCQTSQVGPISGAGTRDEEGHAGSRRLLR